MTKIITLLTILVFPIANLFGQQEGKPPGWEGRKGSGKIQTEKTESPLPSHIITTNVLSPISPVLSRLRLGYIQGLSKTVFVGLNAGIGIDTYKKYEDYQLYELRPEIYFVLSKKAKVKHYFSFEYFYVWHHEVMRNSYYNNGSEDVYYDKTDYERRKYGFHLKWGFFGPITTRLGFNYYVGLGSATVENNYYNTEILGVYEQGGDKFFMYGGNNKVNRLPSFSMGLKLYYVF
jgi:hypothetical protein